ncbi:MAG: hypothetical protein ACYCTG_13210, partial [Ferrimicrobium sp.]
SRSLLDREAEGVADVEQGMKRLVNVVGESPRRTPGSAHDGVSSTPRGAAPKRIVETWPKVECRGTKER